mmetsp:Transcript_26327/g.25175  ORF Transcript_26327/g.25175 Transcript_26327/m.25175 type:complete len:261 (+) Transcript_26327:173-955(+)
MAANAGVQDLFTWYHEIPLVSRLYLTAAVGTTTACFMDFVSPLTLYYNYDLILRGQYWRLVSSFLFFGSFSLDFLFHLYFVVRYCRLLEEGNFRGRTADFIFMLIFGGILMLVFAVTLNAFSKIKFLGHPLAFMMVYIWARAPENVGVKMSLMGLFPFNAPYLPWVLLLFSLFLGNPIETDLLGILVGHLYYFFDSVYPHVAEIRDWSHRKILVTPSVLRYICSENRGDHIRVVEMPIQRIDVNNDVAEGDRDEQHQHQQ